MLKNELAKILGDVSLTPIEILTGWGTQKMRKFGMQLKKQVLENHIHWNRKARGGILPQKTPTT